MTITDALVDFAREVRKDRAANPEAGGEGTGLELLIAPRFRDLIEAILPEIVQSPPSVLPEYTKKGLGRPDLAFAAEGAPARAFVELKSPEKSIDPAHLQGHDADQFRRFSELPVWALSNFLEIRLFRRGELVDQSAILPSAAIDPATSPTSAARLVEQHGGDGFARILQSLAAAQPPSPGSAREIAEVLGHAARLVRSVMKDQCADGLDDVVENLKADFNETLFARAEAGGYDPSDGDALFASAFSQTLVFGLLLAREASGSHVGANAHELLPDTTYPLLRGALRALTQEEVRSALGVAFDIALDAVNSVDPALLAPSNGRDPVLYLFEDFLRVFDPDAVKKFGVYYTPPEVVHLIVAEVDRVLRERMDANGLLDENVSLLDPACGTGTFLVAAANAAAESARSRYGEGAVAAELTAFSKRMHGFELLVGPYTVAHYRMLREIAGHGGSPDRLPIFLTDTLAPPASAKGVEPHLAFLSAPMVAERKAADRIKSDVPILAILGNPPYRRLSAGETERLIGAEMNRLWEDLKRPVRDAGMGSSLNVFSDLYIAFYRWALWKLFESDDATRRGVVGFISNRGFLTGNAFGGLRKMLRERFDHIRIIDLRGDSQGAVPATVERDENVFNIKVGVCVLVAYATGGKQEGKEASVEYADVWGSGAFSRNEKLALAGEAAKTGAALDYVGIEGTGMDRLKPFGFSGMDWPGIDELFTFPSNGIVTYRDKFVYATSREELSRRIRDWHELPLPEATRQFKESTANKVGPARSESFKETAIQRVSYRPFDIRHLYNSPRFVDRPRPDLASAWSQGNVGLICLNDGTGAGPAVWCHGDMPDQHGFRGSYGGWIWPLWNPASEGAGNFLIPSLVPGLSSTYGNPVEPQQVFDAILALLSATSYTVRFARDLEDDFPHVPFPADPDAFRTGADIGARIRELQAFAAPPKPAFKTARMAGTASAPKLDIPAPRKAYKVEGNEGSVLLRADGSLSVRHVSERAWNLSVSGYRVLYKWLKARDGRDITAALQREALDVVGRIEEFVTLRDAADEVLERAIATPVSRDQLGLPARESQADQ